MQLEFQIYHLITGLLGGLVRGIVGITKQSTFTPEKFQFQWKYFAFTMFVSALVGLISGIIADGDWRISLLAGYAGTDFLESLYRLRFTELFKIGELAKTTTTVTEKVATQTTVTPVTSPATNQATTPTTK